MRLSDGDVPGTCPNFGFVACSPRADTSMTTPAVEVSGVGSVGGSLGCLPLAAELDTRHLDTVPFLPAVLPPTGRYRGAVSFGLHGDPPLALQLLGEQRDVAGTPSRGTRDVAPRAPGSPRCTAQLVGLPHLLIQRQVADEQTFGLGPVDHGEPPQHLGTPTNAVPSLTAKMIASRSRTRRAASAQAGRGRRGLACGPGLQVLLCRVQPVDGLGGDLQGGGSSTLSRIAASALASSSAIAFVSGASVAILPPRDALAHQDQQDLAKKPLVTSSAVTVSMNRLRVVAMKRLTYTDFRATVPLLFSVRVKLAGASHSSLRRCFRPSP